MTPEGREQTQWTRCAHCGEQAGGNDPCCAPCRRDLHAHCPSWPSCKRADYGPCRASATASKQASGTGTYPLSDLGDGRRDDNAE